jgi:hypothetical protein
VVNGTQFFIAYNTDGVTVAFDFPYYLFQFSDLVVWYTDPSNNTTQLLLNSAYTLAGNADSFGAYPGGVTLTTTSILTGGGILFITRSTQKTQMLHFVDNDSFPAEDLEHGLDKLTLMAQEQTMFLGMTLAPPSTPGLIPGQWYGNAAPVAGGYFGWIWSGTSNEWLPFGQISL